jgi:hypothetical protein
LTAARNWDAGLRPRHNGSERAASRLVEQKEHEGDGVIFGRYVENHGIIPAGMDVSNSMLTATTTADMATR